MPKSTALLCGAAFLSTASAAHAQDAIIVTATRVPEPELLVPVVDTVIDGQDARDRGAFDLRSALVPAAGVEVLPGSDSGPAGSVVAMQGLTEMDAYLLVVDGVPYGGAFNPATATFDLIDFDRIEVLRGAAPVTFGATSFVGVIHVLRAEAGKQATRGLVEAGTRGSARASFATSLGGQRVRQSLLDSVERRGFSQDDSDFERAHLLYRGAADLGSGTLRFDLDGTILRQDPYSPHPREGSGLSDRFKRDANVNPRDAAADQDRAQANVGYESTIGELNWVTTLSASRTWSKNVRGYLREGFDDSGLIANADGYRQHVDTTDLYADSHVAGTAGAIDWVLGADWLFGRGRQRSKNFVYAVLPDGSNAPRSNELPIDESTVLTDRRSFAGAYAQLVAKPTSALTLLGGIRLNRTSERRCGGEAAGDSRPQPDECQSRTKTRLAGSLGASYALWSRGGDAIVAFADYRNTYKPAAIDFGPEAEADILRPETASSWEAGLKADGLGGRLHAEASYFDTRFRNLVIRENIDGLPTLASAGRERFRGFEAEIRYAPSTSLQLGVSFAHHLAKFVDYARLRPNGSIQQLAGKRLELSPKNVASAYFALAPERGLQASAALHFVGSRFLNKSNTVKAGSYATLDGRIGWKFANRWGAYLAGENLTDRRDPVTESEIGDAQFYRLPGRRMWLSLTYGY